MNEVDIRLQCSNFVGEPESAALGKRIDFNIMLLKRCC